MGLREYMQENKEKIIRMDLDTFGKILDELIRENEVGLMVHKTANSEMWNVKGVGCGAVMDFYIFLNAAEVLFRQMLNETKGIIDAEKTAESMGELVKECLIRVAREEAKP